MDGGGEVLWWRRCSIPLLQHSSRSARVRSGEATVAAANLVF
jgi:hypothetical protein